ncbi:ribosomal protein L24 [Neorickettsia helminthoeca str. Oregon]|uniref:Large ribosomal subunit protein uL24 n=1 Tax=Neorickettsia helminthoeca str. Oregon TaxID=1286528 RepID=X5HLF8_9RICK|nr:50S ribosomal protein L24 [Neorickettsia helminthoeca]AHX11220.1 ribosomal protein L24 [Neorickettsia helminthoeca str. Oregon]
MRRIVTGDQVKIISGSETGKSGVVQKVITSSSAGVLKQYVIVSGINLRRFVKKSQAGKRFETKACPISASNVALVSGAVFSKVGFKLKDGVKRRFLKKTGEFV